MPERNARRALFVSLLTTVAIISSYACGSSGDGDAAPPGGPQTTTLVWDTGSWDGSSVWG